MSAIKSETKRRNFLKTLTAGALYSLINVKSGHASALPKAPESIPESSPEPIVVPNGVAPEMLARDESFWAKVAHYYDKSEAMINLEHGYWGKMSRPVQAAYLHNTKMVNTQLSVYARKNYNKDALHSANAAARALGAKEGEVALTRNATESIHNLLRQYNNFKTGDTVLFSDIDYPSFKETMLWLAKSLGTKPVKVSIPSQTNQAEILNLYIEAFDKNPSLKLMLLTHVSNQHGLILPVAQIAEAAKQRGIDVICDCAQSWGLLDFKISDLKVDWAGFNLHKWIGNPVGVGALYMKTGSLEKISPYPGEHDADNTQVFKRVHTATTNFAATLTVPTAIAFHQSLGPANKEARLRYLYSLWAEEAKKMPHIEVLGANDEASSTGMGAFRLVGQTSLAQVKALQLRLENEFKVFTVVRKGLASGCCIRITPQVFVSANEISQLIYALKKML